MRKNFLFAAIAICALAIFQSCIKSESNKNLNQRSTIDQIKSLDNDYLSKYKKSNALAKSPSAGATVASDFAGALGGCAFGPWGAFCGGVVGSVTYAFGLTDDDLKVNPGATSVNDKNPYDVFGQMHNRACVYIAGDRSNYSDGRMYNVDNVINSCRVFGTKNYSQTLKDIDDQIDNRVKEVNDLIVKVNAGGGGYIELLNEMQKNGYTTLQENEILNNYMGTFLNVVNPIDYSIGAEDIVINSKDLSEESKKKILISMSVARNSSLLW